MASPIQTEIPEGWTLKEHVKRNGTTVKCYTNVLGQEFYTYNDLMRYVIYAKNAKLSIYSPGFNASDIGKSNSGAEGSSKPKNVKPRNKAKKEKINMQSTTNPPVAAKKKNLAEIVAEKQNLEDQAESYHHSSDADLSSDVTAEIAAGMQRLGSHAQCYYNQNLPRDKTAEIAAGKQQLKDNAQSQSQTEASERSNLAENSLVLAPVVDAPARRTSKRLAGLKPKPEQGSSTSKHERRRRASRRLAGLEPDRVPGNGK